MGLTLGSLCTGYGGLEMATQTLFDAELAWVADNDPAVATVLEERMPGIPNYGDFTEANPSSVDVVTAGFPCQPLSGAGRRKGIDDERWLWPAIEALISRMDPRPRLLLLENVPGLLTINEGHAMADVVHGLARLGFVGRYRLLQASDLGACHRRRRWFCIATNTSRQRRWPLTGGGPQDEAQHVDPRWVIKDADHQPDRAGKGRLLPTPAASDSKRGPDYARQRDRRATGSGGDDLVTAVAKIKGVGGGLPDQPKKSGGAFDRGPSEPERSSKGESDDVEKLLPTPVASRGRNKTAVRRPGKTGSDGQTLLDVSHADSWGDYAAAIDRHEALMGTSPPNSTDNRGRLAPAFVEWMMMLPVGWVTDLELARTVQLRILGNGAIPIQAAAAYSSLLDDGGGGP